MQSPVVAVCQGTALSFTIPNPRGPSLPPGWCRPRPPARSQSGPSQPEASLAVGVRRPRPARAPQHRAPTRARRWSRTLGPRNVNSTATKLSRRYRMRPGLNLHIWTCSTIWPGCWRRSAIMRSRTDFPDPVKPSTRKMRNNSGTAQPARHVRNPKPKWTLIGALYRSGKRGPTPCPLRTAAPTAGHAAPRSISTIPQAGSAP